MAELKVDIDRIDKLNMTTTGPDDESVAAIRTEGAATSMHSKSWLRRERKRRCGTSHCYARAQLLCERTRTLEDHTNKIVKEPCAVKDREGAFHDSSVGFSVEQRLQNLEVVLTCPAPYSDGKVAVPPSDDVDWGPWQAIWSDAVPAAVLDQQCAAAKRLQVWWRRQSQSWMRRGVIPLPRRACDGCCITLSVACKEADHHLCHMCVASQMYCKPGLAADQSLSHTEADQNAKTGAANENFSRSPKVNLSLDVQEQLRRRADQAIKAEDNSINAIQCSTCGTKQPAKCHWSASFARLIKYRDGIKSETCYCRSCGLPKA